MQQELDSVKPRGRPRAGDVVVTRGRGLGVACVFHGVLKKWRNGKDDAEAVSCVITIGLLVNSCSSCK